MVNVTRHDSTQNSPNRRSTSNSRDKWFVWNIPTCRISIYGRCQTLERVHNQSAGALRRKRRSKFDCSQVQLSPDWIRPLTAFTSQPKTVGKAINFPKISLRKSLVIAREGRKNQTEDSSICGSTLTGHRWRSLFEVNLQTWPFMCFPHRNFRQNTLNSKKLSVEINFWREFSLTKMIFFWFSTKKISGEGNFRRKISVPFVRISNWRLRPWL